MVFTITFLNHLSILERKLIIFNFSTNSRYSLILVVQSLYVFEETLKLLRNIDIYHEWGQRGREKLALLYFLFFFNRSLIS